MGRGNAVARVARVKERLQAAAEAQAEIGRQALAAIDGGADPETVIAIAEAAAKEAVAPEEPVVETQFDILQKDIQVQKDNEATLASQPKTKIKLVVPDAVFPCTRSGSTLTGKKYTVNLDASGIAEVAQEIADHLIQNSNGKYVLAD